jgi:nucleotide sugar dehydrogenase
MGIPSKFGPTTVTVVGLGYVGVCVAATLASRGLDVVGLDVDRTLVEELEQGRCRFREERLADLIREVRASGALRPTTDPGAVSEADVVVIAVGTPVRPDGSLADGQLRSACEALAVRLRPGQLVVLKSTVPPGTTRDLVRPLLEAGGLTSGADFALAFTPERLSEGAALRELGTLPIIVGGLDESATAAAGAFWARALGVEVITVDSPETAEIVKIATNSWIDVNIAVANELAKYCALHGVDMLDVISAANSLPKGSGNVNILLPSVGVGGSCLTKDPLMLLESAGRQGLDLSTVRAGREANDGMPGYTTRLITEGLASLGVDLTGARVAVLGLAFKNNTGDLRATPVRGVVEALAKAGVDLRLFDPLVDTDEAERLFGIRPATTLDEAVRDADGLAVLAFHREFTTVDFGALPVASPCLLVDGRAYLPKEKISELSARGYAYRGIGRPAWPAR